MNQSTKEAIRSAILSEINKLGFINFISANGSDTEYETKVTTA